MGPFIVGFTIFEKNSHFVDVSISFGERVSLLLNSLCYCCLQTQFQKQGYFTPFILVIIRGIRIKIKGKDFLLVALPERQILSGASLQLGSYKKNALLYFLLFLSFLPTMRIESSEMQAFSQQKVIRVINLIVILTMILCLQGVT